MKFDVVNPWINPDGLAAIVEADMNHQYVPLYRELDGHVQALGLYPEYCWGCIVAPNGEIGDFPLAGYAMRFTEGLIDGPTYFVTRSFSEVGNFALGFNSAVNQYGLITTIDKGKFAVIAPEKRFNAIKFSFHDSFKSESFHNGYGDKIPVRNGMRIIDGVTTFTPSAGPWYINRSIDAGLFIFNESNSPYND